MSVHVEHDATALVPVLPGEITAQWRGESLGGWWLWRFESEEPIILGGDESLSAEVVAEMASRTHQAVSAVEVRS